MIDGGLCRDFVDMHVGLHREFVSDVMAIRAGAQTGVSYSTALLRFLTSWLTFHILGTDKLMARQLQGDFMAGFDGAADPMQEVREKRTTAAQSAIEHRRAAAAAAEPTCPASCPARPGAAAPPVHRNAHGR